METATCFSSNNPTIYWRKELGYNMSTNYIQLSGNITHIKINGEISFDVSATPILMYAENPILFPGSNRNIVVHNRIGCVFLKSKISIYQSINEESISEYVSKKQHNYSFIPNSYCCDNEEDMCVCGTKIYINETFKFTKPIENPLVYLKILDVIDSNKNHVLRKDSDIDISLNIDYVTVNNKIDIL